ncbi:MAG: hypothetical protein C0418_03465 [Coriobacteriaceae bacterium]|nr:hypothetical protein [Coriobacteriaceae bacterium]
MRRPLTWFLVLAAVVGATGIAAACRPPEPLRIGVLLPLSGPQDRDADEVLDWAAETVNAKGGIDGRKVELIYKDSAEGDIKDLAQGFIDDPSIEIVIGPETSAQIFEIAPTFTEHEKLLISPSSTAGDVFRAFGKKRFFWRTCQSDVAQVRTILHVLASRKVKKFTLVYEDTAYGKTFSEWMGFFATEREMQLLDVVKFQPGQRDLSGVVTRALEGDPEYVVCAAFPQDSVRIKKELDKRGGRAKLLLTDAAETQYVLDELGDAAEGLELVSPAADPDSGFEAAFEERFGYAPWDFAAPTYDAFYLAVCALASNERQKGRQGIEQSLADVVSGRGPKLGWDGIDAAVCAILNGESPDITGASGSLAFDGEFGVDPLQTFYALNRVGTQGGVRDFRTVDTLDSDESLGYGTLASGAAAGRTLASAEHSELATRGVAAFVPGAKGDSWAVVVATSKGWENYRHQADALAVYDTLKRNGFGDERIILLTADDVPESAQNPRTGDVHNSVGGRNLRKGAVVDYAGANVTVANLEAVLLGDRTAGTPTVLETDGRNNVFLFIVDHGEPGAVIFEEDTRERALSAERLNRIVETMSARKRYRQMLVLTEVCYGEGMALDIDSPGVVCLAGAGRSERSFATNYDGETGAWLADDFTYQALDVLSKEPQISIADLYERVYERVAGSHVRIENQRNFGDVYNTRASDFVAP